MPQGYTELLRTSVLAFLLSPELAYAEPEAYALYLDAWSDSPAVAEGVGEAGEITPALLLAFPELAHRLFYVAGPGTERRAELSFDLPESEWIRVFGLHRLADLPTQSVRLTTREWLTVLQRPPLAQGWARLRRHDLKTLWDRKARSWLRVARILRHRPVRRKPAPYTISRLTGPELVENRLRPFKIA